MNLQQKADAIRGFNRFYTKQIGLLQAGLLSTQYSLTEARMIFELAQRRQSTASVLRSELGMDAGYTSRVLGKLERGGLVSRVRSKTDGRQRILRLTGKGRRIFETLNSRALIQAEQLLRELRTEDQDRLLCAMEGIQNVLGDAVVDTPTIIRPHRPGDIGWVTHRHGVLYWEEYRWDETFEALVAGILSDFVKKHDPKRERSWIAETDGEIVGCVFVTRRSKTVASLRLLLVEPGARGKGLGTKLVDECIRFARGAGYRKITLWTNSVLLPARHIYRKAGFRVVRKEPHHSFGKDLVGETWELLLTRGKSGTDTH
jgi:DNA-binding MarR family transcriptional regulator/GNAT superfamily N-acetyltransferase